MSETRPDPELPIGPTARLVLQRVGGRLDALWRVALTPVLALFVVQGGFIFLDPAEGETVGARELLSAVALPVALLAYAVLIRDWLRALAAPDGPVRPRLHLEAADLRFLLKLIGVGLLALLSMIPLVLLGMALQGVPAAPALVAAAGVVVALSTAAAVGMGLPAAARGDRVPLPACWAAGQPVLGRIAAIVALTVLPLHLLVTMSGLTYGSLLTQDGGGPVVPVMALTLALEVLELGVVGALWHTLAGLRLAEHAGRGTP